MNRRHRWPVARKGASRRPGRRKNRWHGAEHRRHPQWFSERIRRRGGGGVGSDRKSIRNRQRTHTHSLFSQNTSQGFQGFSRRDHPVEPAREPSEIKSRPTASQCKIDRDPFPAGLTAEPPRRGFQKILGPRRQHFASRGEIPSETKRKKQKQKKKRKIFNESDRHTGTKKNKQENTNRGSSCCC